MLEYALQYAGLGWPVFPVHWVSDGVCSCGDTACRQPGKHPATPRGLKDASADPEQLKAWWGCAPSANIGVAVPDGVCVVDEDPRNGGDETVKGLDLPATLITETGGGGRHYWYTLPAGVRLPGKLGDGVDLKQSGGYVIAPPSTHPSGGAYAWRNGMRELAAAPEGLAAAPEWLAAKARTRGAAGALETAQEAECTQPEETLEAFADALAPHFELGKRHHAAFALGGWLRQRGWSSGDVAEVVRQLPSYDPEARVKDALDGFGTAQPHGFEALGELLGEEARAELDRAAPNPRWQAELEMRRAGAELIAPLTTPRGTVEADDAFEPWDLTRPVPPLDYLLPDLELAPGRVNMIAGYGNVGKTAITQALAFAVALGLPVFGRFQPTRRCRVLHLDYEAGHVALENYQRLARAHSVHLGAMAQWLDAGRCKVPLDDKGAEAWFTAKCQGYGLVVIDTLRASLGSSDENAAEACRPLYMLGRVSEATGAVIIVLHHEKKPDGTRRASVEHMISGHNAIYGAVQTAISFTHDEGDPRVQVSSSKRVRGGFESFHVEFVDVPDPALENDLGALVAASQSAAWGLRIEMARDFVPEIETEEEREERQEKHLENVSGRVLRRIEGAHPRPVTVPEIRGWLHESRDTIAAALGRLLDNGQIRKCGGNPERYCFEDPTPAPPAESFAPPLIEVLENEQSD